MSMEFAYLRSSGLRDIRIICAVLVCALISTFMGVTNASAATPVAAHITVNAGQSLGTLTSISRGLNTAVWDGDLLDGATTAAVKAADVHLLRYPGGSTSDVYNWESATNIAGQGYANPNNTFDAFMGVAQATRSQAMITVNYGGGTPQEAADWVKYANKGGPRYNGPVPTYTGASSTGHRYGAKYWEIGNEIYGNGTYGADWEYDTHPLGSSTYATNVVAFSQAMKAVDPTINVGVVLTAPGNWPDGVTSASSPQPWNDTVLPIACSSIDFVVAHWYPQGPGSETDAGLLASTNQIAAMVSGLRAKVNQYCGAHASAVKIMITETNSVYTNPGRQSVSVVNALYLADNYATWLENGVANVDWWDLHNGIVDGNSSDTLYGNTQYGDYGVLSNGTCDSATPAICEPTADTPFAPYYGLQMLKYLGGKGDRMVSASSDQSLVAVHAVRQDDGSLAVLLINKDPSASYTVSLALKGFTVKPSAKVKVYTYGENSTSIAYTHSSSSSSVTLAPYSLTTLVLSPDRD